MFDDFDLTIAHGPKHSRYESDVAHAEDMGVHIYGTKPVKLLERVRPREDPSHRDYRLLSYEPITTSTGDKGMYVVNKILNPKLWDIKFPDGARDVEDYLLKNYPFYGSMIKYVQDVLVRAMVGDPNGLVVVMPLDLDIPQTEKSSPIAQIYHSSKVYQYSYGRWYLLLDKVEKINSGPKVADKEEWFFFTYVDEQEIVKFKTAKRPDGAIETEELQRYVHGIGKCPVWFLGGITKDIGNEYESFFRSYFSAALPYWNKAVTADSDLDGAFVSHMHPLRVEVTDDCDFSLDGQRCNNGKLQRGEGEKMRMSDCPSCGGSGRKSVKSPYGVYQVPKPGITDQPLNMEPVSYVTVPTEPTRMLAERAELFLKKGLEAMNMFFDVGANQSGIAKAMDRSELYDFLLTISTKIFDEHIYNIIFFSEQYFYMNKVEGKMPAISKSVTFDLLSVNEEAAILKEAAEAGMSASYLRAKMAKLIAKDLFGSTREQKMAIDALNLNTLSGYKVQDVIDGVNAGFITDVDGNIYFNIDKYIQEVYANDDKFYEKSYEEKREIIVEMATVEEEEIPTPPSAPPPKPPVPSPEPEEIPA